MRSVTALHRTRIACEGLSMRTLIVAGLLALLAVTVASCGGTSDAESSGAPPAIVEAEPTVEQFAGTPLAMVFFHPL